MKKEIMMIGACMILVSMALGCSIFGGGTANETKLDVEQGLGIIGTLNVDKLTPGLDGYISLTVRNNLAGESASNVYVSLDNVEPFKIFECGETHSDSSEIRKCSGEFSLDYKLPYRTHGESKMFPGQELEFFWRIRAPSKEEISNIALVHPMYYDLEYDYRTTFVQNVIFMSLQEVLRRRQAGENYQVEGEASSGAGELRVTAATAQPVNYIFENQYDLTAPEKSFPFSVQYLVKNEGKGFPLSDVVVLFEIPKGKITATDIVANTMDSDGSNPLKSYGWEIWNKSGGWDGYIHMTVEKGRTDPEGCHNVSSSITSETKEELCNCNTGKGYVKCNDWVNQTYGSEFNTLFADAINENRLLVKVVKRTDFINEFSLSIPLKIVNGDSSNPAGMYALKNYQIPIQIYGFKIHNMYRYFTSGESEITVYPVKV